MKVQFRDYPEDRESKEYGPYVFAQITYNMLRVGELGYAEPSEIAYFIEDRWVTQDGERYSDVIIYEG